MMDRQVRRGVTQAGWNAQHSTWYALHYVGLSALIGVVCQSWWAFLIALFVIGGIVQFLIGRYLMFVIFSLPWCGLAVLVGYSLGGWAGASVITLLACGVVWMKLESGRQYFEDLR